MQVGGPRCHRKSALDPPHRPHHDQARIIETALPFLSRTLEVTTACPSKRPPGDPMKILLPYVLLVLALPAFAADYHVSPIGSDAAAGTLAQPWKTVNRALTGRAPGDVVHLPA